ncbi:site-specific integrase [Fontisubflavum oceani]|uniref:site-specific integrase n=1 Tax=Fontisubflavum oceani TaxID=2978973 RepID=UPI002ED02243
MAIADKRGFRYKTVDAVSQLPVADLLKRVEAVSSPKDAPALLGTVDVPHVKLSEALEMYCGFTKDKLRQKSPDQIRRWKNPRKKAVRNFIDLLGDKKIHNITRDDMLDFREWWYDRIEGEELTANSGNKDFTHLGQVLRVVNEKKRYNIDLPLGGLSFVEGDKRARPPFSATWIKDKILAKGALDGLNKEARCLLLGMVNTGYRPSEGTTLNGSTINLSAKVPHIVIKTDGRQVKTGNAKRELPLLGVSLEAFRECPEGFPRYFDKAGVSATVNNFLTDNGLRETPDHSFYSLRHSFEDRMIAAEIDMRVRKDLMGHSLGGFKYGQGASLDHAAKLLKPLAF